MTKLGSGYSDAVSPTEAGGAAARQAVATLPGAADMVFVFASTDYDYGQLLASVREVTGAVPLIGCSTAGQFTEYRMGRKGVVVAALQSENIRFRTVLGQGVRGRPDEVAERALSNFKEEYRRARADGFTHATCFVCTDGLAGRGEDLVDAIHAKTDMLAQVVGGAAADDAKFVRTDVFFNDKHFTDAMALAYAFSRSPIGLGVQHGLIAGGQSQIVTRADAGVIREIDGKPAFKAYERFAAQIGETLTRENREAFMITHEIGMLTPSNEYKIRAPLKVNDDGSLAMAAEVPSGSSICIMRGTKESLVAAAESAARSAMSNIGGARAAGVLVFDCICRRIFLGDDYRKQVDAFQSVVSKDVPIVGWETYGEIAMTPSQQAGWHNSTSVVAILPD